MLPSQPFRASLKKRYYASTPYPWPFFKLDCRRRCTFQDPRDGIRVELGTPKFLHHTKCTPVCPCKFHAATFQTTESRTSACALARVCVGAETAKMAHRGEGSGGREPGPPTWLTGERGVGDGSRGRQHGSQGRGEWGTGAEAANMAHKRGGGSSS